MRKLFCLIMGQHHEATYKGMIVMPAMIPRLYLQRSRSFLRN